MAAASDLDQILRTYRHKLCRDPRDTVYGLLSLAGPLSMEPDHSLPLPAVFQRAMEFIIEQSNSNLRYLTGTGFNSQGAEVPS
jgi:hypothetical protein